MATYQIKAMKYAFNCQEKLERNLNQHQTCCRQVINLIIFINFVFNREIKISHEMFEVRSFRAANVNLCSSRIVPQRLHDSVRLPTISPAVLECKLG